MYLLTYFLLTIKIYNYGNRRKNHKRDYTTVMVMLLQTLIHHKFVNDLLEFLQKEGV